MKIVINKCYGGFGLSDAAIRRYADIKGITLYPEEGRFSALCGLTYYLLPKDLRTPELESWASHPLEVRQAYNEAVSKEVLYCRDIPRTDTALIQVVYELGESASGQCSMLEIIEIPDDVEWQIEEYDGMEWVAEKHRIWR